MLPSNRYCQISSTVVKSPSAITHLSKSISGKFCLNHRQVVPLHNVFYVPVYFACMYLEKGFVPGLFVFGRIRNAAPNLKPFIMLLFFIFSLSLVLM